MKIIRIKYSLRKMTVVISHNGHLLCLNKNTNNISVKRTVSIPQWLNNRAMAKKINFSKVMKNALLRELEIAQ